MVVLCVAWFGPSGRFGVLWSGLSGNGEACSGATRFGRACGDSPRSVWVRRGSAGLGLVGYGQLWRGKLSYGSALFGQVRFGPKGRCGEASNGKQRRGAVIYGRFG